MWILCQRLTLTYVFFSPNIPAIGNVRRFILNARLVCGRSPSIESCQDIFHTLFERVYAFCLPWLFPTVEVGYYRGRQLCSALFGCIAPCLQLAAHHEVLHVPSHRQFEHFALEYPVENILVVLYYTVVVIFHALTHLLLSVVFAPVVKIYQHYACVKVE